MRVIAGEYRRRTLHEVSSSKTRSTMDRVKETLFNMLGPLADKTHVLDAFAGSGALGIEALSRGAKHVDFIEVNHSAFTILNKNINMLKIETQVTSLKQDALTFLKHAKKAYDLILLDPPYHSQTVKEALILIKDNKLLQPYGLMVSLSHKLDETPCVDGLTIIKERNVGITKLTFYKME